MKYLKSSSSKRTVRFEADSKEEATRVAGQFGQIYQEEGKGVFVLYEDGRSLEKFERIRDRLKAIMNRPGQLVSR